jgi:alpha-methylacyl-CoA racemase
LIDALGLEADLASRQYDRSSWPAIRDCIGKRIAEMPLAQLSTTLEGLDACFAPVLDISETARHPHNVAREAFIDLEGVVQPAPTPEFSRTPAATPGPPASDSDTKGDFLQDWGLSTSEIDLVRSGILMS